MSPHADGPTVSVVVVVHEMARELPRTLATLAPTYQQGLTADDYEVVVVDNGSTRPVDPGLVAGFPGRIRLERLDPAPPSPARAANLGIARAEGDLVGLVVDGARMASPGLLAWARRSVALAERPVVSTLGWHLGPVRHMQAAEAGYDQTAEDELLAGVDWRSDGYALFGISVLNGSSAWGWFEPMSESSALFLTPADWSELGGLDERFALPGGGLVNHDLYRRACALEGSELITLLGEGTFHQYHGGAATSSRFGWEEMHEDYVRIRGVPYVSPPDRPILVGRYPEQALAHMDESVAMARRAIERRRS